MKWSQNFLVDEKIADRQIGYASISETDIVLEIGPGLGILTSRLASRAKKVIAVEIDRRFIHSLKKILNVEVIHADILDLDLSEINFDKIISNLPYETSTPITLKILDQRFKVAVLMYQKEVAERVVAKPGTKKYSRLSVAVALKGQGEILEHVPPTSFSPKPKVYSSIVRIIPSPPSFVVKDKDMFNEITNALFTHRRKKVGNALAVQSIITKNDFNKLPFINHRADKLPPEQIGELSDKITEMYGESSKKNF